MKKKKFIPSEWIPETPIIKVQQEQKPEKINSINKAKKSSKPLSDIEDIVQKIEAVRIDITSSYNDWRDLGFALADELGESGRQLFHRISKFHPEYNEANCNSQFDKCLNANGHGITISTLFYHAKQLGFIPNNSKVSTSDSTNKLPSFPVSLYSQLPDFLKKVTSEFPISREKDMILLGSMVSLSSCMPNVWSIYDKKKVFPNLFLFATAQASAGKGSLVHCRKLVVPIHHDLREKSKHLKQQYENEMKEYNSLKKQGKEGEKPLSPPDLMLFLPANSSSAGMFQLLSDNDGEGLIFETEGDTLANAFKNDFSNYSDGFRKAYHHETISFYRRTNREYVDIENPKLSAVLSGTPRQISSLITDAEDGLFSRFIFYYLEVDLAWKNVFEKGSKDNLDDYFKELADEFYTFNKFLRSHSSLEFCLTAEQQLQFNNFFQSIQDKFLIIQGEDYLATVRRLGLIAYRFAMILSVLRIMETGEIKDKIECVNEDFNSSIMMIEVLIKHSAKIFSELPGVSKHQKKPNRKEKFLDNLPENFNRKIYLAKAEELSIPSKTAEGYITAFASKGLIHRESHDNYNNLSIKKDETPNK